MPIYEYQCNQCGITFEIVTRLSEAKYPPLCPECSSPDTQKRLSAFTSSLSGSSSAGGQSRSGSGCGSSSRFS